MVIEKKNELTSYFNGKKIDEILSAKKPFHLGFRYLSGLYERERVFLIREIMESKFHKSYGLLTPKEIVFSANAKTIEAEIRYEDGEFFSVQIKNLDFDRAIPKYCAYYQKGKMVYLTERGTEYYKDIVQSRTLVTISSAFSRKYDAFTWKGSCQWAVNNLIAFLLEAPGYTNGPGEGASKEEIAEFLKKRENPPN